MIQYLENGLHIDRRVFRFFDGIDFVHNAVSQKMSITYHAVLQMCTAESAFYPTLDWVSQKIYLVLIIIDSKISLQSSLRN